MEPADPKNCIPGVASANKHGGNNEKPGLAERATSREVNYVGDTGTGLTEPTSAFTRRCSESFSDSFVCSNCFVKHPFFPGCNYIVLKNTANHTDGLSFVSMREETDLFVCLFSLHVSLHKMSFVHSRTKFTNYKASATAHIY